MDSFKIDFLVAIGEVTEYTGLKLDYGDVATILNNEGRTSDGDLLQYSYRNKQ